MGLIKLEVMRRYDLFDFYILETKIPSESTRLSNQRIKPAKD